MRAHASEARRRRPGRAYAAAGYGREAAPGAVLQEHRLRSAPQLARHHRYPTARALVHRGNIAVDPGLSAPIRLVRARPGPASTPCRPRTAHRAGRPVRLPSRSALPAGHGDARGWGAHGRCPVANLGRALRRQQGRRPVIGQWAPAQWPAVNERRRQRDPPRPRAAAGGVQPRAAAGGPRAFPVQRHDAWAAAVRPGGDWARAPGAGRGAVLGAATHEAHLRLRRTRRGRASPGVPRAASAHAAGTDGRGCRALRWLRRCRCRHHRRVLWPCGCRGAAHQHVRASLSLRPGAEPRVLGAQLLGAVQHCG
mmetsp:Transcript_17063/g.42127  ORF Transcript_17063/g.42127 Transcript_17063/m.42127 type:complete len:310 (+) Transcript_17063:140-1069(+)